MTRKAESDTAPAQTDAPLTALPPELLDAVGAVTTAIQNCDKLDQAINEVPADRERLDREHGDLTGKLAATEADLALCDRGSDIEIACLKNVEKLTDTLTACERERRRIDARELALESQGTVLDESLKQAVGTLQREVSYFTATLREAIAQEYRAALPPLLVARARLQALVPLGDRRVYDVLADSALLDPAVNYMHLAAQGDQRLRPADADLLNERHPDADAAGQALATLLAPVAKALAAGRRPPFRSLRERRQARGYEGQRGYTISTGRPDAAPAAPLPKPAPPVEEQMRHYQIKGDSSGARSRAASADMNIGAQLTANLMRGD